MINLNKVPGWFLAILAVLVAMMVLRRASEGNMEEEEDMEDGDIGSDDNDQETRISRLEDFMNQAIADAQGNDESEYEADGLSMEEQESMQ